MTKPPDFLSSEEENKKNKTLFSWLSLNMSVYYFSFRGEMMQHGRLAPQNWMCITCLHFALTASLLVFMVIRGLIPFIIIIQMEFKQNHVAA